MRLSGHFNLHCRVGIFPIPWNHLASFLFVSGFCNVAQASDSRLQQSSSSSFSFPTTYRDKYLAGSVIKSLQLDDWLQCLTACASSIECISYNFNKRLSTCELNSQGITGSDRQACLSDESLVFSQGLIFQQVKDVGYWSPWQPWSLCSTTCGNGARTRMRTCVSSVGGGGCSGSDMEKERCNLAECLDLSKFCLEKEDGDYEDSTNCHQFIKCSGKVAHIVPCIGSTYDPSRNQCVHNNPDSDCS
ncbi:uncharacterized protein [Montipora foliosa]|uniref:uncharacterized protein isoform X1 n=1 Tax=Montipora foliosa TaxID=591990 RepID=UPI0035F16BFC